METITILVTGEVAGGLRPFEHAGRRLEFARCERGVPPRLFDGPVWAFVDWLLPDLSGLELCRRLRSDPRTGQAHITMVLEEDDPESRRRALRAGADDYLVGPLDRHRLLDRVLAGQTHEAGGSASYCLTHGEFVLDLAAMQLRHGGKPVALMPNELRLMRFLMEHPGRILSRDPGHFLGHRRVPCRRVAGAEERLDRAHEPLFTRGPGFRDALLRRCA